MYGDRTETMGNRSDANSARDGLSGLKALGVRDLHYRMCFMASSVHAVDTSFDWQVVRETAGGDRPQTVLEQFTQEERQEVEAMRSDTHVYQKIYRSVCGPGIFHGTSVPVLCL